MATAVPTTFTDQIEYSKEIAEFSPEIIAEMNEHLAKYPPERARAQPNGVRPKRGLQGRKRGTQHLVVHAQFVYGVFRTVRERPSRMAIEAAQDEFEMPLVGVFGRCARSLGHPGRGVGDRFFRSVHRPDAEGTPASRGGGAIAPELSRCLW